MPAATMCDRPPAGSDTNPQVRGHAENRTPGDITGQAPGTLTRTTPERESASQRFLDKIAEYTDLFWFDVLGRLPVIGDRLADHRSDRNFRRE